MIITKCDKQCIFVNMIGYCCLDDHNQNIKHTETQCQRGQLLKAEMNKEIKDAQKRYERLAHKPSDR